MKPGKLEGYDSLWSYPKLDLKKGALSVGLIDWFLPENQFTNKGGVGSGCLGGLFSRLLQLFPRLFSRVPKKPKPNGMPGDLLGGGNSSLCVFISGSAQSFREITDYLKGCEGELKPTGIPSPSYSTVLPVSAQGSWKIYQPVFFRLREQRRSQWERQRKFCLQGRLAGRDSTIIDRCATIFDWGKSAGPKKP